MGRRSAEVLHPIPTPGSTMSDSRPLRSQGTDAPERRGSVAHNARACSNASAGSRRRVLEKVKNLGGRFKRGNRPSIDPRLSIIYADFFVAVVPSRCSLRPFVAAPMSPPGPSDVAGGEDTVGDLPVGGGVDKNGAPVDSRLDGLRTSSAPRGKLGTPGNNKPMITTVAPWAIPKRSTTEKSSQRRHVPPTKLSVPKPSSIKNGSTENGSEKDNDGNENNLKSDNDIDEKSDSNPSTSSPPTAFLDQCPGLSDRDATLDVKTMTYGALFKTCRTHNRQIVIPVFQRLYCWTSELATRWWSDAALGNGHAASKVKGGHGTGKCLFRTVRGGVTRGVTCDVHGISSEQLDSNKNSNPLLCLDGQQRVTTCLLAISAIRDAAQFHVDRANSLDDESTIEKLHTTIAKANQHLFLDNTNSTKTLRPSHADRDAFDRCIDCIDNNENKNDNTPLTAVKKLLLTNALEVPPCDLLNMLGSILDNTNLTYVEILGSNDSISLPQAFQWLQEKTLFAASAVLWNPTPGVTFSACDLVRNFLLSFLLTDYSLQEQEDKHVTLWLQPLQSRFVVEGETTQPEAFDSLLRAFVENEEKKYLESQKTSPAGTTLLNKNNLLLDKKLPKKPLRQCATERDLRFMVASEVVEKNEVMKAKTGPNSSVWTYALFRSFAERVAIENLNLSDSDDDESTAPRDGLKVDFISSVPAEMWEGPAPSYSTSEDAKKKSHNKKTDTQIAIDEETCREVVEQLVAFGVENGFLSR